MNEKLHGIFGKIFIIIHYYCVRQRRTHTVIAWRGVT
jgi:hypothetical protein